MSHRHMVPIWTQRHITHHSSHHVLGIRMCQPFSTTLSFQGRYSHLTDENLRFKE